MKTFTQTSFFEKLNLPPNEKKTVSYKAQLEAANKRIEYLEDLIAIMSFGIPKRWAERMLEDRINGNQ